MKWRLILVGVLLATGGVYPWSVNTDLVTFGVTVTNMNPQAMEDVKANDFRVTEDGKPQQIAVFLFRKMDIDGPVAGIPAAQPASSEDVSTQTVAAAWRQPDYLVHRRMLAIVFDFSSMAVSLQARARRSAIDFIRGDLKPADLVTVMATARGKLEVLEDLTDDRSALETAVNKSGEGEQPESDILSGNRKLIAIEDACRQLSKTRLVGNKALLYFSGGFPLPGMYIQTAWANAANACGRANTAIYPITEAITEPIADTNESLSRLATVTGGNVSAPHSDMTASMRQARDNVVSHYLLGYYSNNMRPDGAYRKVNIGMVRIGMRVSYQFGYFADTSFWSFRP